MSEDRFSEEIRTREEERAHAGEIVEGSGTRGSPRRLPQMVSVRLDARLVVALRVLARQRGVTMSDLLREGAKLVLEGQHPEEPRTYITSIEGASEQLRTRSRPKEEVYALQ